METLGGVAIGLVILYGGWQVINDARTPGAFFSSITALLLAYATMKSLATLNTSLQEGLAAVAGFEGSEYAMLCDAIALGFRSY